MDKYLSFTIHTQLLLTSKSEKESIGKNYYNYMNYHTVVGGKRTRNLWITYLGAGNGGIFSHFLVLVSNIKVWATGPLHCGPYCPETMYTYLPSVAIPKCEFAISFGVSNLSHQVLSLKLYTSTWECTYKTKTFIKIKLINVQLFNHLFSPFRIKLNYPWHVHS